MTMKTVSKFRENPEEMIIDAGRESASKARSPYEARQTAKDTVKALQQVRDRHNCTSAPSLALHPVKFTGDQMTDEVGEKFNVVEMNDGSQWGCSIRDTGRMIAEIEECNQPRNEIELRGEDAGGRLLGIIMMGGMLVILAGLIYVVIVISGGI